MKTFSALSSFYFYFFDTAILRDRRFEHNTSNARITCFSALYLDCMFIGLFLYRLEGKVAIVTGGARGIGEATVRLFVKKWSQGSHCRYWGYKWYHFSERIVHFSDICTLRCKLRRRHQKLDQPNHLPLWLIRHSLQQRRSPWKSIEKQEHHQLWCPRIWSHYACQY